MIRGKATKSYPCPVCGRLFDSGRALGGHMRGTRGAEHVHEPLRGPVKVIPHVDTDHVRKDLEHRAREVGLGFAATYVVPKQYNPARIAAKLKSDFKDSGITIRRSRRTILAWLTDRTK